MTRLSVAWILLAAVAFGGASLAYPWTDWDTASATYIAATMLEGGAPYRDAWNVKFPGVNFTYALSIVLFGKSAFALRLFDLLWQCATALVLACIAARIFKRESAAAVVGCAYLMLYYMQQFGTWAEPDGFLNLPMALGFLALLHALENDHWRTWGLTAIFIGIAGLFKPPVGLFGVVMIAVALIHKPAGARRAAIRLSAMAVGVILPWIACAAYLVAKGAWQDFLTAAFTIAPQFVKQIHSTVTTECRIAILATKTLFPLYLCITLGLASICRNALRRMPIGLTNCLLLAWLATGVITYVLHGAFLLYHLFPVFAPAAVLAAAVFEFPIVAPSRQRLFEVACLVLFLAYPLYNFPGRASVTWQALSGRPQHGEWHELAQNIRAQTQPSDRIFIWGNAPIIYLYAERKSASRFIMSYFLFKTWRNGDLQSVFLGELQASRPRVFVVIKEGRLNPCGGRTVGALEALDRNVALKEILAAEYRVESETPDYILYVRSDSLPNRPEVN
jgi:hypothetical protein